MIMLCSFGVAWQAQQFEALGMHHITLPRWRENDTMRLGQMAFWFSLYNSIDTDGRGPLCRTGQLQVMREGDNGL